MKKLILKRKLNISSKEHGMLYNIFFEMVESLLFIGTGAGVGAGEKNTRNRIRPKTDRLHNSASELHSTYPAPYGTVHY